MAKQEVVRPTREIPLTPRGAATRDRIVHAAADLMYVKGVHATTLDDVRAATGTSKSQLYRHFPDKDSLVHAVIALRGHQIMTRETQRLGRFNSFSGLVRWRNALIQANALQNGAYGCALGSMASELSDEDEQARVLLAGLFKTWEELIAAGLERMQAKGTLKADADPEQLAVGLMAALQGGYLLANTAHDVRPMEIALDQALEHLKSYVLSPAVDEVSRPNSEAGVVVSVVWPDDDREGA
ncbi:MAG TPA: TetR/AcrR family transcriptional regulator [Trebonia sp.]|jgi:TetR/AcrR family transcriptional repressor of nem operon|nr:TetR/AcrR family transcriptional regulator [Trebonia sp.]